MKLFFVTLAVAGTFAAGTMALVVERQPTREVAGTVQMELALGEPAAIAPDARQASPLDFDLLRVEKESILLAGRAAPDSDVEIVSGNQTVATVRAGKGGDFVYVHRGPPTNHSFRLRSGGRLSNQVAVVASGTAGEPLALITEPAEATNLLRLPFGKTAVDPSPVTVEAVDVDESGLFVAGKAPVAGTVRVYLDDTFLGETSTGADRNYLIEVPRTVAPGRHVIRTDLLGSMSGTVVARAEVPLVHEPEGSPAVMEDDPDALRTGASIIIRPGDSLWRISRRAFGRGTRYTTIFEANRDQIRDPDRIYAGQVFKLPRPNTSRDDG